MATHAVAQTRPSDGRVLKGRDLITIGIFTAIYFVIQFATMLLGGLHPALWVFMPVIDGLLAGVPFMLMCAKVQKPGAVVIMGLIVALGGRALRATPSPMRCSGSACAAARFPSGCSTIRSWRRSRRRA